MAEEENRDVPCKRWSWGANIYRRPRTITFTSSMLRGVTRSRAEDLSTVYSSGDALDTQFNYVKNLCININLPETGWGRLGGIKAIRYVVKNSLRRYRTVNVFLWPHTSETLYTKNSQSWPSQLVLNFREMTANCEELIHFVSIVSDTTEGFTALFVWDLQPLLYRGKIWNMCFTCQRQTLGRRRALGLL